MPCAQQDRFEQALGPNFKHNRELVKTENRFYAKKAHKNVHYVV